MKTAAIICEFNPFHNGHKYILDTARSYGYERLVVIMSGSFTQRGDTALISKFSRAAAALYGGADLVLELPVTYAVSPAQRFALGGVEIASQIGADALFFGSECADVELLKNVADAAYSEQFKAHLQKNLSSGITFAAARERAILSIIGADSIPTSPNDNLAVEYIAAINQINKRILPVPVKRIGAGHDSSVTHGEYCSASYIRAAAGSGNREIQKFMPSHSYIILMNCIKRGEISSLGTLDRAFLYRLRTMTEEEFARLPDISEGLENRLISAAKVCDSIDDFLRLAKSKRYTLSRIRRIAVHALLGTDKLIYDRPVEYLRVLAMNKIGEDVLSDYSGALPIITRCAQIKEDPVFSLESRATDIHMLSMNKISPSDIDLTAGIITDKNIDKYLT